MKITVFISASQPKNIKHYEAVRDFAQATAAHTIITGGDPNGMCGTIGDEVKTAGGHLIGITTDVLVDKKGVYQNLDHEVRTKDFDERKKTMINMSDVIVCFPGGSGTFEEIFQAISWGQCGLHNSPYMFFNVDGYYNHIEAHYDFMLEEGFIGEDYRSRVMFPKTVEEIMEIIGEVK